MYIYIYIYIYSYIGARLTSLLALLAQNYKYYYAQVATNRGTAAQKKQGKNIVLAYLAQKYLRIFLALLAQKYKKVTQKWVAIEALLLNSKDVIY